jgi:signal transduction histidine kinase
MRSIARHLLAWTLGALIVGSLLIVGASYLATLEEMNEVFDDNLRQVAMAVASHQRPDDGDALTRGELPALPSLYDQRGDFNYVTLAWSPDGRLRYLSDPAVSLPFSSAEGLARVTSGAEQWHVYTIVLPGGVVQAAQRTSARKALAGEAASPLLSTALLLVLLTAVLLAAALRRGLRPLDVAAADVARRSEASLEPIDEAGVPREIHPLIRAINGLMRRLSRAFSAQRRFVADAAHELRSPVTALKLQLQLLERARDEAARTQAVMALKAGVERAQRLIEQLLDLSRLEPDAPLRRGPVDLAEIARSTVAHRSAEADSRNIDLGAEAPEGPVVAGDRAELAMLLDNLVGNALRHAATRIDVQAGRLDGQPALLVIDDGPGIPEAERELVFDRFHRGADSAGMVGSGLGLAIVRAVAERHGAIVSLHTAPGGRGLEARVLFMPTATDGAA